MMKNKLLITLIAMITSVGNVFSQSMIISGGNDHGIALCTKGQIFAWGYNAGNRLCLKDPSGDDVEPSPKEVETGSLTFSMLSAGSGGHSVALSCNKVVYCWGSNEEYQCGRETGDIITGGKPVPVYCGVADGYDENGNPGGEYLGNVKYISATTYASMAILDDGTGRAVIWGKSGGQQNSKPQWIKGADGKPLKNVIHITGGDDNILLIVGDSPDAKVGTVYSLGNWNGRGGGEKGISGFAAPVEIGDGTGGKSSGKYLTNVRTSGLSDTGGFAVDGETGYVYGWGHNGWWGVCGLRSAYKGADRESPEVVAGEANGGDIIYAEKVISGEYKEESGEEYLTDAVQVIGGNGNGTIVTKEGYVLYWGDNSAADPSTTFGGVIPNTKYATDPATKSGTAGSSGPVFANYCKGEHGYTTEHRVEDAVAVARGDLYGFMVNKDGEFYVWGSTARPTDKALKHVGTLGTGNVEEISTCFKKIEIQCKTKDLCPEAFMLPEKYKCPGKEEVLYSGFSPLKGREDNYFYQWSKDGVPLGTAKATDNLATRKAEIYNKDSITVTDPGLYRVDIYYVGSEVPCENCPDAFAECNLIDMEMPIDIDTTAENCVSEPLEPDASDQLEFSAVVNNKFYTASTNVTFAAFSTPTSTDTLKDTEGNILIFNTTGDGGKIGPFKVYGNDIDRTLKIGIDPREGVDTLYHIWLEDITKFETVLREGTPGTGSGSYGHDGLLLDMRTSAELISFDLFVKGWGVGEITITPQLYAVDKNSNGQYVVKDGGPIWSGEPQTFGIDLNTTKCEVKCNHKISGNSARGVRYILGFDLLGGCSIFNEDVNLKSGSPEYPTPFIDTEGFGIYEMGVTGGKYDHSCYYPSTSCYYNIKFGKLTDYDCGRIPLSARYYCPPCNHPKELEITADKTISSDTKYKKIVELCKGEDVTLDIEPLVGKTDANAKFDIYWFDKNPQKNASATALDKDETGRGTTLMLTTDWATVAADDSVKVYYVYVHDHEKPGCDDYDSIKVIAHSVPMDTLEWNTFCLTSPISEPSLTIADKTIIWSADDPTGSVTTLEETTSFKYVVKDDATGCKSEVNTYTVTVNQTEEPNIKTSVSKTMHQTERYPLSAAEPTSGPDPDCVIYWYDSETGTTQITDVPLAVPGEKIVWAEQYNTVTDCASKRVKLTIKINEAPVPEVHDEFLCIGDEILDLSEYVEKKENHTLNWYPSATSAKGTGSSDAGSFKATEKGTKEFHVSQTTPTGDESDIVTFTITVYEVATLKLDDNPTSYCIGSTASPLVASSNGDGKYSSAQWSTSESFLTTENSLTPSTTASGTVTYYARGIYDNSHDAYNTNYASDVCYGKVQSWDIEINKTEKPTSLTNFTVQYLKEEGKATNSFKPLSEQNADAVKVKDSNHTLVWYKNKDDVNPIPEPSPIYDPNQEDDTEETYWVRQYNSTTGCYSEPQEVTVIVAAFCSPVVQSLQFCQGQIPTGYKLEAKKTLTGNKQESDFDLIWYKKDPKTTTIQPEDELTEIVLDQVPEVKAFNDNPDDLQKDFTFWVIQRYNGEGGGQSYPVSLGVTVFAKPKLITNLPDPICIGEEVDLRTAFTWSERIPLTDYKLQYYGVSGEETTNVFAKESGIYKCRTYFYINEEKCSSNFESVEVTVQELDVKIDGLDWTCPEKAVDLEAVIAKEINMSSNDKSNTKYSWRVSPTGVESSVNDKNFNTTSAGLTEDQAITVKLDVEMGACKANATHKIKVLNPGVEDGATITFEEAKNTKNGTMSLSNDGSIVSFDGCNDIINITLDVKHTEDMFTYKNLETNKEKKGSFNTGGKFTAEAGMYEVSFTNTCPASFKFVINDKSLDLDGVPTNWAICEGEPLTITIVNHDNTPFLYDSKKYTVSWEKDGVILPQYTKEKLYIPETSPSDNGLYSYNVVSSGCVYHKDIAKGIHFKSKPRVKIDSARLENKGVYEVVRTQARSITLPFIQPDMSQYEEKIIWREYGKGVKVDGTEVIGKKTNVKNELIGQTLEYGKALSDHNYQITIAYGSEGYDNEICGATIDLSLKVDALLSIKASLVDGEGNETKDMCLKEEGVGIKIDTSGTGTILHSSKLDFKLVEEISGENKKEIKWVEKDGYLFAEISPKKSAKYNLVYKYEVGNQDSSKTFSINVHPAYEVEWETIRICDGDQGYIPITKAEPSNEIKLTWKPDESLINSDQTGAYVLATYTGTELTQTKKLTLVATNGGYCAPKEYYPQFIIDKSIEGTLSIPDFICSGHEATLDASDYKATSYTWSSVEEFGEGVTMSGASIKVTPKTEYPIYKVDMARGACTESVEGELVVRTPPEFDRIDSLSFREIDIVIVPNTGTSPFQYIIDDNYDDYVMNAVKDGLDYGSHNIKVIDGAGCVLDTTITIKAPDLEFPVHISPNGDGKNDVFSIPTLRDAYPDAKIRIFDRWGKKLADYKAGDSDLDWDGSYNGANMPSTDYWYEIEIKEIEKTYVGHFTLIRQ